MRREVIDRIKKENKVLCVNKKEIKENLTIGEKGDIQYKCNSEIISSIYNVSGIGGYGLNLI